MAGEKSKILVVGGTGYIGKHVVKASARLGHPTFALVRDPAPSDPAKAELLESFKSAGVTLLQGDLGDHASLVRAIKQADVVISTVGFMQLADQFKLIAAVKEAGNVKRFVPSDFGNDVEKTNVVEPMKSVFGLKTQIHRAIQAEGIPCTVINCNFFAGYFLPSLAVAGAMGPPTDKVVIMGDGNAKAVFVDEDDIGTFTIRAVEDPRTLNKAVHLRPKGNVLSHNELVDLWEKKTGKKLERVYVPEEEVLKQIQEAPMPMNALFAVCHAAFVKGDHTNYEIVPEEGFEGTELYPDVKYTTVDEYLNRLL